MPKNLSRAACLIVAYLFVAEGVAHGEAFKIPYQGAAAAGQAEAFAAQADDPSALYYNPAGLTQVRRFQIYAGTALLGGAPSYTSPTGVTAHGDLGGSVAVPPPSNLYITANLKDLGFHALGPLSLGIGLNSPYGISIRYPGNGPFSSAVTSVSLPMMHIQPTLAYKIADLLSIGLGADIYTFASFLGQGQFELKNTSLGPPSEINGSGTSYGFNASALLTPLRNAEGKPLLNLAVVYRNQSIGHLGGQLLVNGAAVADARTTLVLPQVITGAIAVWPIRDHAHEWKLEVDMDFIGWNAFRSFDVQLSSGGNLQIPQNWKNTYVLNVGTEYKWIDPALLPQWDIAIRAGYKRSHTPIPAATFTPAIPDADFNLFAVGVGLLCKEGGRFLGFINCGTPESGPLAPKAIGLDLAFSAERFEPRTISGNINPTVNGSYKLDLYVSSLNLRVMF
jgi:long-chain fatty acid transport protein